MFRIRSVLLLALGCCAAGATSCAELGAIPSGVCGNGIVEPEASEDCDGANVGESLACGAPGKPSECRFDCAERPDGTRPSCPGGMRCGQGGICRAPSGGFSEPVAVGATLTRDLGVADLDGDGRQDVVLAQHGGLELRYFDLDGSPQPSVRVPSVAQTNALPLVAELSDDARADVVVPFINGLVVALGTADRSVVSTAYGTLPVDPTKATDVRAIFMEVAPDQPGDEALVLGTMSGVTGLAIGTKTGQLEIVTLLPAPATELADLHVADLDEDPVASPCEELVFSYRDSPLVYGFSPCKLDPVSGELVVNTLGPAVQVALPSGAKLRRSQVEDLDDDGHLDLLITAELGAGLEIDVAFGVGDGSFHSSVDAPVTGGDNQAALLVTLPAEAGVPLCVGDLDGDGLPDYVTAREIRRSLPGGGHAIAGTAFGADWTEAVLADFNANGTRDVLAISGQSTIAEFFDAAPGGHFTRSELPARGRLSHLTVGDFDGDLLLDAAMAERRTPGTPRDTLAVAFGSPAGAPEPPVGMGLLDEIVGLFTGDVAEKGVVDGATDTSFLALLPSGDFSFGGFSGRADRQLRSAFVLTRSQGDSFLMSITAHLPLRLIAGQFTADTHPDLAAITLDEDLAWLVQSQGEAQLGAATTAWSEVLPSELAWERCLLAAIDLDRDGLDELVAVAPASSGVTDQTWLAIGRAGTGPDGKQRWTFGSPVELDERFEQVDHVDPVTAAPARARLRALDVDGDGARDLVGLARTADPAQQGRLVVWFNDGSGQLGPKTVVADAQVDPRDVAGLQLDRDRPLELAVLVADGVLIADFGAARALELSDKRVAQADGPLHLGAGDLDGDGVDDLTFATATELWIARGLAVLP